MAMSGNGLVVRVVTAVVLASVFLGLVWVEAVQAGLALAVTLVAGVSLQEYFAIMRAKGIDVRSDLCVVAGMLITASGMYGRVELLNVMLVAGAIGVVFLQLVRPGVTIDTLVTAVGGLLYVGWTAGHVNLLHSVEGLGAGLVTVLIVAVALTDCGAYFVGKAIGKHKLAPVVSPNKTWEGSVGGFVLTGAGMAVLWWMREGLEWTSYPDWAVWKYFVMGAVLSIASQIGDLTESALKRDAGVKDSGKLLPGHGGVLDRCDGYLFAAPVLFYLVVL